MEDCIIDINELPEEKNTSLYFRTEIDKALSYIEQQNILLQDMELQIKSLDQTVIRLNDEVEALKERYITQKANADAELLEYSAYKNLQKIAAKAETINPEEWKEIYDMVINVLPNFHELISSNKYKLNNNEFKTCILIRLHFVPKEVASMLCLSQSSITKIRKNLMQKLFGENGNSKELDERLKMYL